MTAAALHTVRRRRPGLLLVAIAVVGAGAITGCSKGSGSTSTSSTGATSSSAPTTAPSSSAAPTSGPAPTSSPSSSSPSPSPSTGAGSLAKDWEGQRYDFGRITDVVRDGGAVVVRFDRQQVYTDDGLRSGKQLTSEPVIYGSTDVPYVNDSTALRSFVVADDAEVLRIADPVPCASDDPPGTPTWTKLTVDQLVDGAWRDRGLDSLTFGADGKVVRVRLSTGC